MQEGCIHNIKNGILCLQEKSASLRNDCPADREELGQATWIFLHTMAAYFPEQPSKKQSVEMSQFITLFSHFYPCEDCAYHMQKRYHGLLVRAIFSIPTILNISYTKTANMSTL